MTIVHAVYYDGKTSRRQPVTLSLNDGWLLISGEDVKREETFNTAHLSEKLGSAPRLLQFEDGAHCEVSDHAGLEALLHDAGYRPHSLVSGLETHWRYAALSLLLIVGSIIAAYLWGLPWAAKQLAYRIPYSTAHFIDSHVLETFNQYLMQPSKLSDKRKQQLQNRFDKLRNGHNLPDYPLEFRSSAQIGANAFALPGGTVVITDELIKLADNDEQILAVLAHELGHVSERHSMRQLLQGSVVSIAVTWYLGDISSLLATAPTLILQSNYSRDFERRADRFAAQMLQENKISANRLGEMLQKLESSHGEKRHQSQEDKHWYSIFSSHPDTDERIRNLK